MARAAKPRTDKRDRATAARGVRAGQRIPPGPGRATKQEPQRIPPGPGRATKQEPQRIPPGPGRATKQEPKRTPAPGRASKQEPQPPAPRQATRHPDPLADEVDAYVRSATVEWPEIDGEVEAIVVRIERADRLIEKAATASRARVGITREEFKVLINLHAGMRSHGSLCNELMCSTGAMTNRLDKLERTGLVRRQRDPNDRRGVLLELTAEGRAKLDAYVDIQARRERELLHCLDAGERQQLNALLRKLVRSMQEELGSPYGRGAERSSE